MWCLRALGYSTLGTCASQVCFTYLFHFCIKGKGAHVIKKILLWTTYYRNYPIEFGLSKHYDIKLMTSHRHASPMLLLNLVALNAVKVALFKAKQSLTNPARKSTIYRLNPLPPELICAGKKKYRRCFL